MVDHVPILGEEPRLSAEERQLLHEGDNEDHLEVEEFTPELITRGAARKPGRHEVAQHNVTHTPHAPWCELCVAGRGVARPHLRQGLDERDSLKIDRVCFDWAFLRDAAGGSC